MDERPGAVYGAVHVGLSREVHDRPRPVLGQQPLHQRAIADAAAHEDVAGVTGYWSQGVEVARVRQGVEVNDLMVLHQAKDEVAPDKASAAGYEDGIVALFHSSLFS
jgi:hypothetical protein